MKTTAQHIRKSVLLILFLSGISVSFAADQFAVTLGSMERIQISLTNVVQGERLEIRDFVGNVLFSKRLKDRAHYQKDFDLHSMRTGVYLIEVQSYGYTRVTPVLKNRHGVRLMEQSRKTYFEPQFLKRGASIQFSLLNNEQTRASIAVYDAKGDILSHEEDISDLVIKRHYDVSQLPIGQYMVVIRKDHRSFTESFTVHR